MTYTTGKRCGNTKSARKRFFQDLGNKCTSQDNAINAGSIVHTAIIQDEHVNASKQLDGEMGSCDKIGNQFMTHIYKILLYIYYVFIFFHCRDLDGL